MRTSNKKCYSNCTDCNGSCQYNLIRLEIYHRAHRLLFSVLWGGAGSKVRRLGEGVGSSSPVAAGRVVGEATTLIHVADSHRRRRRPALFSIFITVPTVSTTFEWAIYNSRLGLSLSVRMIYYKKYYVYHRELKINFLLFL